VAISCIHCEQYRPWLTNKSSLTEQVKFAVRSLETRLTWMWQKNLSGQTKIKTVVVFNSVNKSENILQIVEQKENECCVDLLSAQRSIVSLSNWAKWITFMPWFSSIVTQSQSQTILQARVPGLRGTKTATLNFGLLENWQKMFSLLKIFVQKCKIWDWTTPV